MEKITKVIIENFECSRLLFLEKFTVHFLTILIITSPFSKLITNWRETGRERESDADLNKDSVEDHARERGEIGSEDFET